MPEYVARFHYLRDLLRSRPVEYAAALREADPTINVTALLAHAYDLAFDARDERLPLEVLTNLVKEGIPQAVTAKRIEDALRQTNEFSSRLLPYLTTQIEVLAGKGLLTEADAKPLRKIINEVAKPEPVSAPARSILQQFEANMASRKEWARVFEKETGKRLSERDSLKGGLAVWGGVIAFLIGAYFYQRDLPEAATWFKVAASRVLLLVADFTIFFTVVEPFTKMRPKPGTFLSSTDRFKPQMLLIPAGLFYVHGKVIAPLVSRNQLWQFLINLPAVILFFYAWLRFRDNADASFRNKE
jgi:hypothetical protein